MTPSLRADAINEGAKHNDIMWLDVGTGVYSSQADQAELTIC